MNARVPHAVWWMLGIVWLSALAFGKESKPEAAMPYDADTAALVLARKYLAGGEEAHPALLEALERMGWSVRGTKGELLKAPPAGTDTGLALRDYELEELLWKPAEQPAIRLISVARAVAVPFEDADPEELAQDLVESLRKGAESTQPQQRFWARFIIALGRVSAADYDLTTPAPAPVLPPDPALLKKISQAGAFNPMALIQAARPTPVWPTDDPVLGPSPRPRRTDDQPRTSATERDNARLAELQAKLGRISEELRQGDAARQKAAQEKMMKLTTEMAAISQRMAATTMQQMATVMQKADEDNGDESAEADSGSSFTAEWRDQPLSLLQIALITRVLAADLRQAASRAGASPIKTTGLWRRFPPLPLATIGLGVAQAGGPPASFSGQFSGAAGDIWATVSGGYTSLVLDHHLPENRFSKGVGIANVIIAWFKTIMTVARQNITIEVENAPLVRTKTRAAGQQRTARCKVIIDFPKSEVLKAIRAAGNLTSLDIQLPDGGPVGGAKVVWRLPEGSEATKYQTKGGGAVYRPDLAVVQFAQAGGPAAYISYTDDNGEATITLEGKPQRKELSATVRKYPRRAVVAVEVTIKVGNITQDLNDAINTAMGGPVGGTLSFLADMVLRTSFFFQKGRAFEVTDWKEPAWQGEFEITVKGAGSKHEKGEKGGPDIDFEWRMNRFTQGRMHTPDWEEEKEQERNYDNYGRHALEVDGDSRYFRLDDSSSSRTRDSHNRYEAVGPMQIQPPGRNQLEIFSRAEPSGNATLTFTGGVMTLDLQPFFGAQCIVGRSEQGHGRSSSKAGPEYLSLLNGVSPDTFTVVEHVDEKTDYVEGTKTFNGRGNLPYVPSFDIAVTVKYRLWRNDPPPPTAR
jgi:hypothetical protein